MTRPPESELRRAEAATWGERPRPQMRLIRWRPVVKNSLRGFADLELPNGLRLLDCPALMSSGRAWATLPGKPQIDADGRQNRDAAGKPSYIPVAEWRSKELREGWSDRVAELVRQEHPEAL